MPTRRKQHKKKAKQKKLATHPPDENEKQQKNQISIIANDYDNDGNNEIKIGRKTTSDLLKLECDILNMIWLFVPFEIVQIHPWFRSMPLAKYVKDFYLEHFESLTSKIHYALESDHKWRTTQIILNDLIKAPLLPCVNTNLNGYEKLMNQLSNRSASFLCILGRMNNDINPNTIISSLVLPNIARRILKDAVCCLAALATAFCGILIKDVRFSVEFSELQHMRFASGIYAQRLRCKTHDSHYSFEAQGTSETILQLWCRNSMLWTKMTFVNKNLSSTNLKLIVSQPYLRNLDVSQCNLDNDCASLLASWMANMDENQFFHLRCTENHFAAQAQEMLLQAYRNKNGTGSLYLF